MVERCYGRRIMAKGCHRDSVRPTRKHVIRCAGLKWVALLCMKGLGVAGVGEKRLIENLLETERASIGECPFGDAGLDRRTAPRARILPMHHLRKVRR
jgi:hypothetical protein